MNDRCTRGVLLALLNYLPILFDVVRKGSSANFRFKKQLAEYDKLFELITMKDKRELMQGTVSYAMHKEISFEHVSFSYDPEKPVRKDVTFTIPKGKWIGIAGESGAGKSTLFSLLLQLYEPDHGKILLDGTDLKEFDLGQLRKNIALVSQDTFLFPGTIEENLRFPVTDPIRFELKSIVSPERQATVSPENFIKKQPTQRYITKYWYCL